MSKEEIFMECFEKETMFYDAIYKAMSIYAKSECIEFAEWTQKNFYEQDDEGLWYKWALRDKI